MTAVTSAPPTPAPAKRGPGRSFHLPQRFVWPGSYLLVAALIWLFFYLITEGYLSQGVANWANTWMPIKVVDHCLIWAMAALGLNVVVGYAGLLDLGYVAFWALGSYVAGWLMSGFFFQSHINILGHSAAFSSAGIHVNFWFVLIVAAAFVAMWGVIIGAPTLRLRSDYLALVTLGFGEIIPQFFHNADSDHLGGFNAPGGISNGTKGIGPIDQIGGVKLPDTGGISWGMLGPFDGASRYIFYILIIVVIVFVTLRLRVGRLGRAWLALREDELAASAMGVPVMKTKLSAYAVGAIAGGLAGVCFAVESAYVNPDSFSFSNSITLLAMVVLGGMGNVYGVILGAIVVTWFNETGLTQIGNSVNSGLGTHINLTSYNFMIFGAALVLMMLFRREGFLPEARTKLVLREPGRTELESLGADMEEEAPELAKIEPVAEPMLPPEQASAPPEEALGPPATRSDAEGDAS